MCAAASALLLAVVVLNFTLTVLYLAISLTPLLGTCGATEEVMAQIRAITSRQALPGAARHLSQCRQVRLRYSFNTSVTSLIAERLPACYWSSRPRSLRWSSAWCLAWFQRGGRTAYKPFRHAAGAIRLFGASILDWDHAADQPVADAATISGCRYDRCNLDRRAAVAAIYVAHHLFLPALIGLDILNHSRLCRASTLCN